MVFLFITAWRTGVLHCLAFVSLRGSCKEKLLFQHIFRNWGQECEWSLLTFVFGVGGGDILIGMSDTRMRIIQLTRLSVKPCLPFLLTWLITEHAANVVTVDFGSHYLYIRSFLASFGWFAFTHTWDSVQTWRKPCEKHPIHKSGLMEHLSLSPISCVQSILLLCLCLVMFSFFLFSGPSSTKHFTKQKVSCV